MQNPPRIPKVEDVERIKNIKDPIIRNLQITQCYYELSRVLDGRSGMAANWCTFATWASKQAGQTIRKEDLARLLERRIRYSTNAMQASASVAQEINIQAGNPVTGQQDLVLTAGNFRSAIDRASDAVSRGNKKVFEEIGYEFARFYQSCFIDQQLNYQNLNRYCEDLRAGDPPEGQGYLQRAFTHYAQALIETNGKAQAELILLANIEIGFHEQTRLQPEIAESLDAGLMSFLEFSRSLLRDIFPANGWFHLAHLYLRRLFGRPTPLDLAIQSLLSEIGIELRHAITEIMMTISFPSGVVLNLGQDLAIGFPESLKKIGNPELVHFLEQHDLTPDSLIDTGAVDWADLPDRLHFILDLFRCYQELQILFEPPFTPQQVKAMDEGRFPDGNL